MLEDLKTWFSIEPYSLTSTEKEIRLRSRLLSLTEHHRKNCLEYARFLNLINFDETKVETTADIPFFPVRLFKLYELLSVERSSVFKIMTSSGTSGQKVSKIFLDKATAMLQQQIFLRLLSDFIGHQRVSMLVIDSPSVLKDRKLFSARGGTIIGLSFAARETIYALKEDMSLNLDNVRYFCEKYLLWFGSIFTRKF